MRRFTVAATSLAAIGVSYCLNVHAASAQDVAPATPDQQRTVPPNGVIAPDIPNSRRPAGDRGPAVSAVPALQPLADLGQRLVNMGIQPRVDIANDFAGNPVGGLKQGYTDDGLAKLRTDVDLDRLAGWKGGQLHVEFMQFWGKSVSQAYIGNNIKVQGSYFTKEQFDLSNLSYEQSLFDNRLNIIVGRITPAGLFDFPTYGCQFVGGAQCPNQLTLFTGTLAGYPYATWGTRWKVKLTRHISVSTGVFEINPKRRLNDGFDFSLKDSSGMVAPVEIGWGTSFAETRYPQHFKVGGWYNNNTYTDPRFNSKGQPITLFPGAAKSYPGGRGGMWVLGDQVIYRPDASARNLAVFASYAAPFDQEETYSGLSSVGGIYNGPLAARPNDVLAAMVTYVEFTPRETGHENDILRKADSASFVHRDEYMFEVNYAYNVIRGLSVIPNIQYIVDPDITGHLYARTAPKDALVLGFRATLHLGDLLGLPTVRPE